MTSPQDGHTPDDTDGAAGEAGALAAASRDEPEAGDPLGPLNRITEDEDS